MPELGEFIEKLDLQLTQMRPFEGFIFVCGGQTDITSPQPLSVRDALLRALAGNQKLDSRLRMAEDFKDWSFDSHYRDLVSFERHLAELSSVIVLILESPGSIAELGLFAAIDEFHSKLLVVIESEHYKQESFIKLGPIDFLEKCLENKVECHRWFAEPIRSGRLDPIAAIEIQQDLVSVIEQRASLVSPERRIDLDSWRDRALVVCDLINLCSALTAREISDALTALSCDGTDLELRQMLFILERLGLIAMQPKGSQRFYVSLDSRRHIRFKFTDQPIDLDRFRMDQLARYQLEDKRRLRAIHDARSRGA